MKKPAILADFGRRVRELRSAGGHSQESFAGLANIDRGFFGKIERGEINAGLVTMSRIAVALGISLPELLDGLLLDADEIRSLPRSARGPRGYGSGHAD